MNARLTVLALVAVLLAAFAVPALAAPSTTTPDLQGISVRALAKARLALLTARSAKHESRRAARTAEAALNAANEAKAAKGTPGPAGPQGPAGPGFAPVQSAFAAAAAPTESESYVQLPGGPGLSVDVPSSGLIEVWAQATLAGPGAIALFEDGQRLAGQSEGCAPSMASSALLAGSFEASEPITVATPSSMSLSFGPFFFCGVEGPPAGVLFQTTPGPHTYELRYQLGCGCEPEVTFSDRLLRIAPRS